MENHVSSCLPFSFLTFFFSPSLFFLFFSLSFSSSNFLFISFSFHTSFKHFHYSSFFIYSFPFLPLNCCLSLSLVGYVRCFLNCLHLSTSCNFFIFLSFCFIFLSLSCQMALTVARTVSMHSHVFLQPNKNLRKENTPLSHSTC